MQLHEFPTQIESQSRSANPCLLGIVGSHKATKDLRLLTLGNPYPPISDADQNLAHRTLSMNLHFDETPSWAVLDGVGQQVRQDLFDPSWVYHHQHTRGGGVKRESMALGGPLETGHHPPGHSHQVHRSFL